MPTSKTIVYAGPLYFNAVLDKLNNATELIEVEMFLMRTGYAEDTRSEALVSALERASEERGVRVCVILNASRFEPDVFAENYATSQRLIAAGCEVRFGPANQTVHTKMVIVDRGHAFVGSHNWSRGALSYNREESLYTTVRVVTARLRDDFYNDWEASRRAADVPSPEGLTPVLISLGNVTTEAAEIHVEFTVNHNDGVEAFAVVASANGSLAGTVMGPTVTPTERAATVIPNADPGAVVYIAVRAYSRGQAIATSNIMQLVYQPAEPGGGGGEPGGGDEPPPPEPLTAPTLSSVTQTGDTQVTASWEFVGYPTFLRFEVEQRDLMGSWHVLGVVMDASARQWTGTPVAIMDSLPFRITVYDQAGESATSNEVLLAGETPAPLTAPVLDSVVAGLNGTEITVTWTFAGCENFHRFEVRKQVSGQWSVVGTIMDPAARQWVGPGPGAGFTEATYRVVVFNMAEESAASNEITITGEPPVPLQAPVLVSVTQIGPMGIDVEYSHVTPAEFARYEVQQMMIDSWSVLGTITTPETRSWSGGPIPYMDATHPVRVVVFVQSGDSAGSNEMGITLM